jgi:hypothetical protein
LKERNTLAREKVLWRKWRLLQQDCKQYGIPNEHNLLKYKPTGSGRGFWNWKVRQAPEDVVGLYRAL